MISYRPLLPRAGFTETSAGMRAGGESGSGTSGERQPTFAIRELLEAPKHAVLRGKEAEQFGQTEKDKTRDFRGYQDRVSLVDDLIFCAAAPRPSASS